MIAIIPLFADSTSAFHDTFRQAVASDCDWIELRLDRMLAARTEAEVLQLLLSLDPGDKTLLYTLRTDREGGEAAVSDRDYHRILRSLSGLPGLVDVELSRIGPDTPLDSVADPGRTILSFHDFHETPADLDRIWQSMEAWHPYMQKIAVMPQAENDVNRLLESCRDHRTASGKIAIAMGETGTISRLWGDRWGSAATFCTLKESSAPGQLSLSEWLVKRSGKGGLKSGRDC